MTVRENREIWLSYLHKIDEEYRHKCKNLHQIDTFDDDLPEGANSDVFKELYNELRDKCFAGFPTVKNIYDVSICPMCEGVFSTKVTLEHIIPKGKNGKYQFAILPLNLVKCCGECNTSKHQKHSTSSENSEINPYFEEFDVKQYITFEFVEDLVTGDWGPIIKLENSSDEVIDKRRGNFINIYNLIPTYQHRVNIEYSRMISTISKQLVFPIARQTMKSYIEYLINQYSANFEMEEGWIDQNYFGKQICATLIDLFNADARTIDQFCEVIKKKQLNVSSLVFEKKDFLKKLAEGNLHQSLNSYLEWLEKLVINYGNDFSMYYNYLKKNQVTYNLPRPNNRTISENTYKVISSMFEYCMNDKQQDFTDFKTKIESLLQ